MEVKNPAAPASSAQINFIHGLLDERQVEPKNGETIGHLKAQAERLNKGDASKWITRLQGLPKKPKAGDGTPVPEVQPGRYALAYPEDELNPVRFFRVNKGKDLQARGGKDWSGFTFVDRYAGDESFPVKGAERLRVLERIAADPLEAAVRYGNEIGHCCICNRKLTRRLSRELGIGPVCGARIHAEFGGMVAAKRDEIIARGDDPDEELAPINRTRVAFRDGGEGPNRADVWEQLERGESDFAEADGRLRAGNYADEQEADRLDALRGAAGKLADEARARLAHEEDPF